MWFVAQQAPCGYICSKERSISAHNTHCDTFLWTAPGVDIPAAQRKGGASCHEYSRGLRICIVGHRSSFMYCRCFVARWWVGHVAAGWVGHVVELGSCGVFLQIQYPFLVFFFSCSRFLQSFIFAFLLFSTSTNQNTCTTV